MKTTDSTTQAVTRLLQVTAQKIWPYVKSSMDKPATAGDLCKKGVFLNFGDVPGDLCDVTIQYAEFKCTLPCEQIFATLAKFEAIAGGKKEIFAPNKLTESEPIFTALVNIPAEVARFAAVLGKYDDDAHNRCYINLADEILSADSFDFATTSTHIDIEVVETSGDVASFATGYNGFMFKDYSLLKKIAGRTIKITADGFIDASIEVDGILYRYCLKKSSTPKVRNVFKPVSMNNCVTLDEVCKHDIINACKGADKNKEINLIMIQFTRGSKVVAFKSFDLDLNLLGEKQFTMQDAAKCTMFARTLPRKLAAVLDLCDGVLYRCGAGHIQAASECGVSGRASIIMGFFKPSDKTGELDEETDDNENNIDWWMNLRRVAHPLNDGDKQSIICSWKALYNMIVTAGNIVDDENGRGYIEYTDEDGDSDVTAVCFTRFGASVTAETI